MGLWVVGLWLLLIFILSSMVLFYICLGQP